MTKYALEADPMKDNYSWLDDLTEKALIDAGCMGPYDVVHRCSNLHCEHCGVCDMVFDYQSKVKSALTSQIEKEI